MFTETEQRTIKRALRIMKTRMSELSSSVFFHSPSSVKDYLYLKLSTNQRETFNVLFLNTQHQLIADEDMFVGTINTSPVYPREIVKRALELNAAAIIVAHNHPSGNATPSQADIDITQIIAEALGLISVRMLDHIVVGNQDVYSFSEHGLI